MRVKPSSSASSWVYLGCRYYKTPATVFLKTEYFNKSLNAYLLVLQDEDGDIHELILEEEENEKNGSN